LAEQSKLRADNTRKETNMRVMLMIKGDLEPGAALSEELLTAMGRYNDELKQAGVLIDLAGCSRAPREGGSSSLRGTARSSMGRSPSRRR
jgi:hypothetical protein